MVRIGALPVEGPRAALQWSYRQFHELGKALGLFGVQFLFSFSLFISYDFFFLHLSHV